MPRQPTSPTKGFRSPSTVFPIFICIALSKFQIAKIKILKATLPGSSMSGEGARRTGLV
jgi:hypothetical protein